ncbi:MAG TPA: DUF6152 family protein [Steroidobacteraceae bacterium]|nr:DUF6152 family protein [Steroidobacteraceae bacterium]
MRSIQSLIAGVVLLVSSALAYAHHSYAMFDTSQVVTVRGVLKTLEWTNPHVWLWVDVKDEKTKSTITYGFESLSPGQLQRDYGWDKRLFKAGETVTIDYAPLKSGNPGGALVKVTLSDGRTLLTRFSKP